MPTIRAKNGEEYTDHLIWVAREPAERRALAVSARRVEGGARQRRGLHLVAGVWVCGDRERIAEVIDNLLTNAVKYSHAGGTVRVCLFERDAGGRHDAVLTVADDGIGIGEQDQERLFTRFFRTPQAQRRAIQGVGLGLSISKCIVEGHGGDIEVASVPDEGTVFTVRLPAAVRPLDLDLSGLPGSLGAVS